MEEEAGQELAHVGRYSIADRARSMFDVGQIDLIKATVMPNGSNDAELALFLETCIRHDFDPFIREIWAIKLNGKVQPVAAVDGLRKKANQSPDFRGCSSGVVREFDLFDFEYVEREDETTRVKIRQSPRNEEGKATHGGEDGSLRGPIVGAWAIVRRAGHSDVFFFAYWKQYGRQKAKDSRSPWHSTPDTMITKCFDVETEVLTDEGFQPFAVASGRIMQVGADGRLEPTDARPFCLPYAGRMIACDDRDLNFSVTPNHRMITTTGVVEAADLFEAARRRTTAWIPRTITGSGPEALISDEAIRLAAAYVADGTDPVASPNRIRIEVSRSAKVEALRALGIETTAYGRAPGRSAAARSRARHRRVVVAQREKVGLSFHRGFVASLVDVGKRIRVDRVLALSRRQARLFVDTWMAFDGDNRGRLYVTRPDHAAAFEVAAIVAGYSVSPRRERTSDLSDRPNYIIAVSDRAASRVVRVGRAYHDIERSAADHGLVEHAHEGLVWCVTVPSGEIVVRRRGFSMRCGQSAESVALRKAFNIAGVIGEGEEPRRVQNLASAGSGGGSSEIGWPDDEVLTEELQRRFKVLGYRRAKIRMLVNGCEGDADRFRSLLAQLDTELDGGERVEDAQVVE